MEIEDVDVDINVILRGMKRTRCCSKPATLEITSYILAVVQTRIERGLGDPYSIRLVTLLRILGCCKKLTYMEKLLVWLSVCDECDIDLDVVRGMELAFVHVVE